MDATARTPPRVPEGFPGAAPLSPTPHTQRNFGKEPLVHERRNHDLVPQQPQQPAPRPPQELAPQQARQPAPQQAYYPVPQPAEVVKRRNPLGVWLGLPLVTLGIYTLVWIYKIHAEMDQANPRRRISAGAPLAAVLLGPFTLFIWPMIATYKAGEHIASTQRAAGLAPTCSGTIGFLLLFLFGLTPLYYQAELNKIIDG